MKRLLSWCAAFGVVALFALKLGAGAALVVGCGGGGSGGSGGGGAADPDYDCTDAGAATTTQLQTTVFCIGANCNDVANDSCAQAGCHVPPPTTAPADYTTAAKTQLIVGATSIYSDTTKSLKMVDSSGGSAALHNSTLWLKVLGGGSAHKGPKGENPGPIMPQGKASPIPVAKLNQIKAWICSGAKQQ